MTDPRVDAEAVRRLEVREAIVRKGLRLQIATELFAAWTDAACESPSRQQVRKWALEHADALITENEAMP